MPVERGLLHSSLPYTLPLCRKRLNVDGGGDSCSWGYMVLAGAQYEFEYGSGSLTVGTKILRECG